MYGDKAGSYPRGRTSLYIFAFALTFSSASITFVLRSLHRSVMWSVELAQSCCGSRLHTCERCVPFLNSAPNSSHRTTGKVACGLFLHSRISQTRSTLHRSSVSTLRPVLRESRNPLLYICASIFSWWAGIGERVRCL